jgi:phage tail sheath protein FI
MPEYLAPGVFIEETSFRQKSIEGVGTSVAALVGPTRSGPLRGTPEVVTNFAEFERVYGDASDLTLDGTAVLNYTSHAARAFFDNGGKQLFVARVVKGVNAADTSGGGTSAVAASRADASGNVTFKARFPGAQGNYVLEILWRDSENLLKSESPPVAAADRLYFLEAKGVTAAAKAGGPVANAKFPLDVRAIVKLSGANLAIDAARADLVSQVDPLAPETLGADQLTALDPTKLPASAKLTRYYARPPASGGLGAGTAAVLTLKQAVDLSAFTKAAHWGNRLTLRGTLDATGELLTMKADAVLNPGLAADVTLPLSALAAVPSAAGSVVALRTFDVEVRSGGANGEVIHFYGNVSTAPDSARSLPTVLAATPQKKQDALTSPVACALKPSASGADVLTALYSLFDTDALSPGASSLAEPRYLIDLAKGTPGDDGGIPASGDYAGETDELSGSTGLAALEGAEDIAIVMVPAAAADATTHAAVLMEMQKHCRKMRYRIGVVDSREGMSLGEVRSFRNDFDDSRLALYHPWVVMADPTGQRREITVPPSGFIAGIYARTDVDRGVHKAPANEVVFGALRFEQEINQFQQELLNPNGINCLRSFAGRGHRVWGGRTLSSDPEWKYVNVRRYFLFLERSIEKSTQWAVFEPNGEALWGNVRNTVADFLFNEWKTGHLLGGAPKEAYFVRCDRTTMTQNDLDNGRLVCVVGVAPLRPAEFVVFRIGQKTADA